MTGEQAFRGADDALERSVIEIYQQASSLAKAEVVEWLVPQLARLYRRALSQQFGLDAPPPDSIGQYVYAIAEHYPTDRLNQVCGIDGAPVTLIRHDGLCALASSTTVEPFRNIGRTAEVTETSWLAEAVRAHEGVAEAALGEAAVLPMRFGAVYSSNEAVVSALEEHRTALLADLQRVGLATEWGLKVSVNAGADEQRTGPAVAVPAEVSQNVTGTDWMLHRSAQLRARERQREQLGTCYQDVHETMLATAREVAQSATAQAGSAGVLELSVLVDDVDRFHAAYESIRERYVPAGFSFRITGPWPPYHFVRVTDLDGRDG